MKVICNSLSDSDWCPLTIGKIYDVFEILSNDHRSVTLYRFKDDGGFEHTWCVYHTCFITMEEHRENVLIEIL